MDANAWLEVVRRQFRDTKRLADRAVEQVSDEEYFRELGGGTNSIAVVRRHMGGHLRSRWRDVLTTDGEKPDRRRDTEFASPAADRAAAEALWEEGWGVCQATLDALEPTDLERTIRIHSEPIPVVAALRRGYSHADYQTGQIVLLARWARGDRWQHLSIPPGRSEAYLARLRERHGGG